MLSGKLFEEGLRHERAVVLVVIKQPEQELLVLRPEFNAHAWGHAAFHDAACLGVNQDKLDHDKRD